MEYRQKVLGREVVRFQYACVALARLSGWEYLEKGPLAAGLAALMQRRRVPADVELRAGLMRGVLAGRLDESLTYQLVNLIETYFPLADEARKRYRQLISKEEYREVQKVELTYFDKLRQEGLVQGKREALKRQLRTKFGPLQPEVEARIDAVASADELDGHLVRVLTASSLDEMGLA